MPLSSFLRLYARLMALAILVAGLCLFLFSGVNQVRERAWQEDALTPLMTWLSNTPDPAGQYHWLGRLYDFRFGSPASADLTKVELARLRYGQVVVSRTGLGARAMRLDDRGHLLELHLRDLYRDNAEAIALTVLWHLNEQLPEDRGEVMASLGAALGVTIEPIVDEQMLPDSAVLGRVSERSIAFVQQYAEDAAVVVLRLRDGTLLQLTPQPPFNRHPFYLYLFLVVVMASLLAGALYLLLREVSRNLRELESVAVRIGRGEMEARVEVGDGNLTGRLARAFNGMADHIQRLVGVQREMIHAVSHELRTPVARIRFGVQMIEDCESEDERKKQLDGIDGDIQELDELIDEILTYARLEQGGPVFSLQEQAVPPIIEQVVQEQRLIRLNVTIEADLSAASDIYALSDIEPRYIHRAIQNLVGNAARYAAGKVRVRCTLDEQTCRIDVEDDGPGIPESDWEKVFTAFARLDDSRTRTSGGYGLGLSIVRRILYWHGGQAFVTRSADLGGACFSLVWPRRKPADSPV